jgi:uncharacterized iron-regulated membrane protein
MNYRLKEFDLFFLRLWHALFGTWIGKLIIALAIGAVVTAIVVGTAVPLALRKTISENVASPTYSIVFNASNASVPAGNINDVIGLAFLQTQV